MRRPLTSRDKGALRENFFVIAVRNRKTPLQNDDEKESKAIASWSWYRHPPQTVVHFTSFSCLFLDKLHPNQNCHTLQNCRLNCFFQYYTEIYVEQGESTVRLGTQLLLLHFLMIHLINAVMYRYLTTCARLQNVLSRRCGFCGNSRHIPIFFRALQYFVYFILLFQCGWGFSRDLGMWDYSEAC